MLARRLAIQTDRHLDLWRNRLITQELARQIDEIEIFLLHYARQHTTKVHNEARLDPRMVEAVTGDLAASFCVGLMAANGRYGAGWREVNGASKRVEIRHE